MATYTLFGTGTPSLSGSETADSSVNLGVGFKVTTKAWLTKVRWYQAANDDCGVHDIGVWDDEGNILAAAYSVAHADGAWNEWELPHPIFLVTGNRYVVSVRHSGGSYPYTGAFFPYTNAPLESVGANGLYAYSGSIAFPTEQFNATNYWVDVEVADDLGLYARVKDDFTRVSDESLDQSANWAENYGAGFNVVSSNGVAQIPSESRNYWSSVVFNDDQWAEADVTLGGSTHNDGGVTVRCPTGAGAGGYNFFWSTENGGTYGLWDQGDQAVLGTWPTGVGTSGTRRLRLEAVGTTLNGYVDGELVLTATDATSTSGRPGIVANMYSGGTTPSLDNFEAGDYEPAVIEDRFTRADGAVGSTDWPANNWNVSSNKAVSNSGFNPIRHATALNADSWVEVENFYQATNDKYFGLMLRSSNVSGGYSGDMYYAQILSNGNWEIAKYVGGSYSNITATIVDNDYSAGSFPMSWKSVRFEVQGNELRLFRNGRLHRVAYDSSITAGGYAGMLGTTGAEVDTFRAGNFAGGGGGGGGGFGGSFIRIAGGTLARVRMPNGAAASVRLADGSRL